MTGESRGGGPFCQPYDQQGRVPTLTYSGMSAEDRRREIIKSMAKMLKIHVNSINEMEKSGSLFPGTLYMFFFQKEPKSLDGTKCYLNQCKKRIWPGECRFQLSDQASLYKLESW